MSGVAHLWKGAIVLEYKLHEVVYVLIQLEADCEATLIRKRTCYLITGTTKSKKTEVRQRLYGPAASETLLRTVLRQMCKR